MSAHERSEPRTMDANGLGRRSARRIENDRREYAAAATIGFAPARQAERYVTRAEMAEMMNVSVKTIDRFVSDGMPSETWGIRSRRFLPSRALAWARSREGAAA